jgi:hypothetical protein
MGSIQVSVCLEMGHCPYMLYDLKKTIRHTSANTVESVTKEPENNAR